MLNAGCHLTWPALSLTSDAVGSSLAVTPADTKVAAGTGFGVGVGGGGGWGWGAGGSKGDSVEVVRAGQ